MDSFMEYIVPKKADGKDFFIKSLATAFIIALFGASVLFNIFTWIGTVLLAVGVIMIFVNKAFILPLTDVEYEYLYCDRQISVDKIMGKAKRKELANFEVDKIEILCPQDSQRLADFNNRTFTVKDYLGHRESTEHKPYVLIYEGKQKVLLDLPSDFVKMVQNNAPRKVYFD